MLKLALYHPKSNYTHYGPSLDPLADGVLGSWDMREAMGEASKAVAVFLDVPVMAILTKNNEFKLQVRSVENGD